MDRIVFVYGSLKKGFGNEYMMEDCVFLGKATTLMPWKMYPNYTYCYPAITYDQSGECGINGELYLVSQSKLNELDDFEGYEYQRRLILVKNKDGVEVEALCYFLNPSVNQTITLDLNFPITEWTIEKQAEGMRFIEFLNKI